MSISEDPPAPEFGVPTPPPEKKPATARTWIAAGVGAVVLTAGAIIGISAASSDDSVSTGSAAASTGNGNQSTGQAGQQPGGGFAGMGTFGTISAIDGSTLTVTSQQSSQATTVTTSDDTTVTVADDATLADVEVGDNVSVSGEGDTTSGITASRITDSRDVAADEGFGGRGPGGGTPPVGMTPPDGAQLPDGATPPNGGDGAAGFAGMARSSGTVASIDGDTMVVTAADGTEVTVTTTSDTTVTIQRQATVADLAVGDTVMVSGETTDGTVAATSIREGAGGFGGPRN